MFHAYLVSIPPFDIDPFSLLSFPLAAILFLYFLAKLHVYHFMLNRIRIGVKWWCCVVLRICFVGRETGDLGKCE